MTTLDTIFGPGEGRADQMSAEQRVEQLLALNKAAIAITGELELDSLLQRIIDVARELVGCQYSALGVLGEDGYLERFPTSGISKLDREKIGAPPRGHGLLGVLLRAGRSLRIPDMSKDPRRVGFPSHHPAMTSLLGVPIFVQGKLVGDLYLTDKIGGPEFSEEDEWIVQLLAVHAATALTNAQLHAENIEALERVSRERTRFQALLKVNQAINRSVHLDEVIQLIVQSASELLGASGATVYLLDYDKDYKHRKGEYKDAAKLILSRYSVGLRGSSAKSVRLPLGKSVAGRALSSGETQVVNDTEDEPNTTFPNLAHRPLRSLAVTPLRVGEQKLGVLSAYSDRTYGFDEEAVQLLEAFGAQASVAIYNARLYEEAEKGREAAELEQQRLRELEHMKDEFLSTAAHELRTPLTTIRMSAGLAYEQMQMLVENSSGSQDGAIDHRLLELLGLILEGSTRMHSLVNDLLDLTRLEQGRTPLNIEDFDLREVVRASVESTKPLFESKQQPLTLHLPETYCGIRGDRERLEQVIINLLSNAHKYSPPGAPVEVRVTRSGDQCIATVRDSGPGVPENEYDLIFERFYRSSLHRSDRTASTGLGLPIARKIAEMHNGKLRVEPAPGKGSIFTLVMPSSH